MQTWDDLYADLAAGRRVIAGVLSGTSADGIDVGLVRPTFAGGRRLTRVECLAFATEPFEPALAARVHDALQRRAPPHDPRLGRGSRERHDPRLGRGSRETETHDPRLGRGSRETETHDPRLGRGSRETEINLGPRELTLLDRDLGRAFGRAARAVAERHGHALGLVASHGQTVWHHDGIEPSGAATLQLGDGDEVAEAAGAAVACDFRRRDIAAGGGGAPLSALADPIVFEHVPRPLCLLNLGGIANVTFVRAGAAGEEVAAFDVGPANALLDGLARRLIERAYDEDGATAARGRAVPELVAELLAHPYYAAAPPKSTGRDTFGAAWLDGLAARVTELRLAPADALASAALAVARSVAADVAAWGPWLGDSGDLRPLVVAGGGVHHRPLLAALSLELAAAGAPRPVRSSAAFDVPPDGREALVFAVLGARCLVGEPSTRSGATGARPGRVLGKLAWPTRDEARPGMPASG